MGKEIKFFIENGQLIGKDDEGREYGLEVNVFAETAQVEVVEYVEDTEKKLDVKHEE